MSIIDGKFGSSQVTHPDPIDLIIPFGGITVLAGSSGVGKTALLAGLLRDLKAGRLVFGHQPAPIPAIGFINCDRSWGRGGAKWFERAGFPLEHVYSMADDPAFNPKTLRKKWERTDRLAEFIDKLTLPQGSLLCTDPFSLFLGGNLLDYDACACACHEIRQLLRIRQLTLLAAAHTAKIKADARERYLRPQDQILGSAAILGFSDTQMYLAAPEETGKPYYTFLWHPHLAPAETFYLERDEQGLFVPYSGADQGNCNRVLAFFPENGDEVTLKVLVELAEAIPLTRRTVFRVLETLIERGRVRKIKHGVYARIILH